MDKIESMIPEGTIPYIEAQIWNHEIAKNYFVEKISVEK
jgi:hypothetical protein